MIVGIDHALKKAHAGLAGKRVGLLSHQAALTVSGATSAQALHRLLGTGLTALFGPEHGFFGQASAGVHTHTRRHPDWKIPVFSLYGAKRKPTPQMMRQVDVVVVDLQDIGARCYTYLATLNLMLEAAAEAGVAVIVTDRPIPLPTHADGPVAEPELFSFVAPLPLPLATGLTPAEAARWIVAERKLDVDLTLIPMRGWQREGRRGPDWPEFVPPSPGIRTWETGMTYLATVFGEALSRIDIGRGTNLAFRVLGAPWIKAEALCEALTEHRLPGVTFNPYRYVSGVPPYVGRALDGVRLAVTDPTRFRPVTTSVYLLSTLAQLYGMRRVWHGRGARLAWFDQLYGTRQVRQALLDNACPAQICKTWAEDLRAYRTTADAVRLY